MLTVRDFLLRLSLCRGIGRVSKVRLWRAAVAHRNFNDLPALATAAQLGPSSQAALLNNWASDQLQAAVEVNQESPYLTVVDDEYPPQLRETFCPPTSPFLYR